MPLAAASCLTVIDDVEWRRSGEPVPYAAAVTAMENRVAQILAGRAPEAVWLLEHPSVYTGGVSAHPAELLAAGDVPVIATARGGRYTYHGPGQRVVYVLMDLGRRGRDVRRFVAGIEEWAIGALAAIGIAAERRTGRVGFWVLGEDGREAKIGAVGLRLRRWVSYHGFAINVCPDLGFFDGIVPCGLTGFGVTSLQALGRPVTLDTLDTELIRAFNNNFIGKFPSALDGAPVLIG
ncbi:MAG: lipoyl(octanoyl) transferase LipB [Rhodospirillales bacterium]|nr:lipoyl(octanoyl) transferase LipB [Rhodospirillales bacterium]